MQADVRLPPGKVSDQEMRILAFCAAFPPQGRGGGPATSKLIVEALAEEGHTVRVLTPAEGTGPLESSGYEVVSLGSPNIYFDYWTKQPLLARLIWHVLENFNPRAYRLARREIESFRPDLVITISIENVNVATWLAARRARVPVAHFIHSFFVMCWRGSRYRRNRNCTGRCASCRVLSIGKKALAPSVTAVVGETDFILSAHRSAGFFEGAAAYKLPSPIGRALELAGRGHERRPDDGVLTVGLLGNISPEKGLMTLAAAATLLRERGAGGIRFHVAGKGEPGFVERALAAFPDGSVRYSGWVDPADFYRSVDVVVVPSIWREPFGRVSVEPLAFGVPVIVSNSGGLPENVEAGVSGLVFEAGSAEALADAIGRVAGDGALLARLRDGATARAALYDSRTFQAALAGIVTAVARR